MISVLLPTMGRPERAEQCVRDLIATTTEHEIEIVCAVDADPETRDRLEPLVDIMLYEDEPRGNSVAWNDCLAASTGDLIVFAADDLRWSPGWLDAALAELRTLPDGWGLVGFNDGHWGAELSTHYLMSRRFVKEVLGGRVAWSFYQHSFNDVEVNERARRAGRYAWARDARVYHDHWIFGDRAQDDTDRRTLGGHAAAAAKLAARRSAGYPDEELPVI